MVLCNKVINIKNVAYICYTGESLTIYFVGGNHLRYDKHNGFTDIQLKGLYNHFVKRLA